MKITVLNGSPKGESSVTMQYVYFIQKEFPQHDLNIFNISQRIKKIEKVGAAFQEILDSIQFSDGILWASPVYCYLVPANYKRFIELIVEKNVTDVFQNKYTAFLSSSIHAFDHTAHNYMHAVCDDLDTRFVGSFSAEMNDLLKIEERERLKLFAANFFDEIENNALPPKSYLPVTWRDFDYTPGAVEQKIAVGDKKVLVVTDSQDHQANLVRMIERFTASFSGEIEVINLWDIDIKGSCIGCLHCGYDNQCVYADKDDLVKFYNTKIKTADILVWAGTIKDRYLSSRWKTFFDRSFFNGHAPALIGKQVGFIISEPLSQVPNLRQTLEGRVEIHHANLVNFVSDEYGDSKQIDDLLQYLARRLVRFANNNYIKSATFFGVGGTKIYRDAIWGRLRRTFRADHETYRKLGVYDFPHKEYKVRFINAIFLLLLKLPAFRVEFNKRIKSVTIKHHQKVLEN